MRPGRPQVRATATLLAVVVLMAAPAWAGNRPVRVRNGIVVSADFVASQVGAEVLLDGGNAVDAAVATAFALAVTHPAAGNIGGGGFLVTRDASGEAVGYDFRETAPAGADPLMFTADGAYDEKRHHEGHRVVGVPGSVAGLHLAWKEKGKLPWKRLVLPAIAIARDGFLVTDTLAESLKDVLPHMKPYRASVEQFSHGGEPLELGDELRQPDLARTLERIALRGPDGFYDGETADLIADEMKKRGGLITRADLKAYRAKRREVVRGTYRGYEVIGMAPPSSGGTALITMLNILEGWDLSAAGFGSAVNVHRIVESMRRAFADRARYIGDPDFNPDLPLARLLSKEHAAELRKTIDAERASRSEPSSFEWPHESAETTHISVVDAGRNAVSLTTTLEDSYGSKIVVPGGGFLLNNEMGDFNGKPGLTDATGLIGTPPNVVAPGKRMLSSMTPTIVAKDGKPYLVVGTPGGRTIINSVLLTILNVIDFGMNIQEAVDAPRYHHQWLPDVIRVEPNALSPDTTALLKARGYAFEDAKDRQGMVQAIRVDPKDGRLEGAADRRWPDSAAIGR